MHGVLQRRHWETTAAAWCHMAWYTDCDSTVQALLRPVQAKIADKRLGIDFAAMRQSLWRAPGTAGPDRADDAMPEVCTDSVHWVDTDVMTCDPLAKEIDCEKLTHMIASKYWDTTQPIESIEKKRRKQAHWRAIALETSDRCSGVLEKTTNRRSTSAPR